MNCDFCGKELKQFDDHIFGNLFFATKDISKKAINAGGGMKIHICAECHMDIARRADNARSNHSM